MKKIIILTLMVSVFFISGCEETKKTLNCTLVETTDEVTSKSTMNIDFNGQTAEKITLEIDVEYPAEHSEYAEIFKSALEEQRKSLEEVGYDVEINSKDNLVNLRATGTNKTLDESESTGSYLATKESLEESGYTCK